MSLVHYTRALLLTEFHLLHVDCDMFTVLITTLLSLLAQTKYRLSLQTAPTLVIAQLSWHRLYGRGKVGLLCPLYLLNVGNNGFRTINSGHLPSERFVGRN